MKRNAAIIAALIFVLMLTLTVGAADTPKQGGTIILGTIGDANTINPVLAQGETDMQYIDMVYEPLMILDRDTMKPVIGPLTTRYESSRDHLVWTFYLKKGVTFSDGHEFTAEDVKYTYEIIRDPKTNTVLRNRLDAVDTIKVIDKYTVQFRLKNPNPQFLGQTMNIHILPAHIFAGKAINTHPANQKPVGTGPFILKEWVRNDHATFVAREDYHRGRIYLDKVIYKVVPNQYALLAAAEAGDIDNATVPQSEVARIQKTASSKGLQLYSRWDFGYIYVGFNMAKAPFNDLRVRKALAMAVYKPAIIKVAFHGQGKPATSNIVPGVGWAYNAKIKDYEYSVTEAKKLLTEAGWVDQNGDGIREKNGKQLTFSVLTNKGNAGREKTAKMLQSFWKNVGAKVTVETLPWTTFTQEVFTKKNFDTVVQAWSGMGPDPDDFTLWHSSQIEDGFNYVSYKNPQVDALLEKARTTLDLAERKVAYDQVQQIIHDEYPYLFLMYTKGNSVFNAKIRGLYPNPLDTNYVKDWKDIYLVD